MYTTALNDLMNIAYEGAVIPPKFTWIETKLRSGMFIPSLK